MARDEQSLLRHIGAGGKVAAPEEMSAAYRAEISRLLTVLADSELAAAAGFAEWINRAPSLGDRQAMVRIVAEKLDHAGQVLALLQPFGVVPELYLQSYPWAARINREVDLGLRRIPGDKRLNVFHYPLQSWVDALLVDFLVGQSLALQLRDLADSSYAPLAAIIDRMAVREAILASLAEPMLRAAIERPGGNIVVQSALNYWYPRAAATFGRLESERFAVYRRYNLRKETNQTLLGRWKDATGGFLAGFGLGMAAG